MFRPPKHKMPPPSGKWAKELFSGDEKRETLVNDFILYWHNNNPQDSPLTNRPQKIFQKYKIREHGYIRFSNPVFNEVPNKFVFVGSGTAGMGVIPFTMFNRPVYYQVWVVEPRIQKTSFFHSKIYDIFYNHREEDYISTPHPMRKIIYPDEFGDIYWHRRKLTNIDTENRVITTDEGFKTPYEFLCITSGAHPYFEEIKGLEESLGSNNNNIFSLYADDPYQHFRFKKALSQFRGGKILFYTPHTKFSHAGISASLVNLTNEILIQRRVFDFSIGHISPIEYTVGDPFIDSKIREIWKMSNIDCVSNMKLVEVIGSAKIAIFEDEKKNRFAEKFDILHVTPPMAAIPAVRNHPVLSDKEGWLDVHYETFANETFPNIFGWGSGTNLPAPKSYFSSIAQTSNAIQSMAFLTHSLKFKKLNYAMGRDVYEGDGYDVVHLGGRMVAIIGSKHKKILRHQHFPYVWESWDSQYHLKDFIDSYYKISAHPLYWSPTEVNHLVHRIYPLEPTSEIIEEWDEL